MRKTQLPTLVFSDKTLGDKYEHPAFGCITVTRPHGGKSRLFGSDLLHNSTVRLEVKKAVLYRGLSVDHHFGGEILCELEMSEAQWATFVSSPGMGGGTPVTLRYYRDGDMVDAPEIALPAASKKEVHGKEMAEGLKKAIEQINVLYQRVEALANVSGAVPKKELKEIAHSMKVAVGNLPSNVKFVYDQFSKATEEVSEAAKADIEAFFQHYIKQAGMEHLGIAGPKMDQLEDQSDKSTS